MDIKTVTIIGANGTLGVGVSAIFASFGNAKVYMVSRTLEKSNQAIIKAGKSVKANSIIDNMVAKDYTEIEKCIQESDLILETIVEELNEKIKIHKIIDKYMKNTAIASSITSGISINELSKCYNEDNKKRFMGIHFFNPPYNMLLCELIPSQYTNKNVENDVKEYLEQKLIRKVINVKDGPGFLANRIGFQFINQAMQYADIYKNQGGIDYIDTILGLFTGRNMSPIATADFVGLDVHKAIVDNIYENTNDYLHDSFKLPDYVNKLIEKGKIGAKVDEGLYKYSQSLVYDIKNGEYREIKKYDIPFIDKVIENFKFGNYKEGINVIINEQSNEAKICRDLLVSYIIYAISISKQIATNKTDCDIAMAEGFNWIPPYSLIELIGKENCKEIALNELKYSDLTVKEIFDEDIVTKYRYEKFMKAKR